MALFQRSLTDFFGLTSSREQEARFQDYTDTMFPFGTDQKRLVSSLLRNVPKAADEPKLMFVFLTIKETWLEYENQGCTAAKCAEAAWKKAQRFHLLPKADLPYVFALAALERDIEDLDELPTVEEILEHQSKLFPAGSKKPDWTALTERTLS